MTILMFVDLQEFIVEKRFIVKEVVMLKQGTLLIHYIFTSSVEIFDEVRQVLCFLVECLSPWITMRGRDGPVDEVKLLITATVFEDDTIVYVKGCEKRM